MSIRLLAIAALLGLMPLIPVPSASAATPTVRVQDLGNYLHTAVTVQGRTGYIVQSDEAQGLHTFTLRDDYNTQALVTMPDTEDYPVMGVTYRVTGWPTRTARGIVLKTLPGEMSRVYPPAPPPHMVSRRAAFLLWAAGDLVTAALLLGIGLALRQTWRRLHPEWGELTVAGGPDRGRTIPLRRRRILLGRGVSSRKGLRFVGGDSSISNRHAELTYRNGELFCRDLSRNGTRIGGQRLKPGILTPIHSGDLIHLGTLGTVIIVRLRDVAPLRSPWGLRPPPAMATNRTLMYTEPLDEEPYWQEEETGSA